VADYIPALAEVDPSLFGACIAGVGGRTFAVGDSDHQFSLQSISKAFVFALVCGAIGNVAAREHLGVRATGLPFDSVMAIELNEQRTMNPMVNAGAMATTSLVPGATAADKWAFIQRGLSQFAGSKGYSPAPGYARRMSPLVRRRVKSVSLVVIAFLLAGFGGGIMYTGGVAVFIVGAALLLLGFASMMYGAWIMAGRAR